MVEFNPDKTIIIFFDLEFYVPENDRETKGFSLKSNPYEPRHKLLGGVIAVIRPLQENAFKDIVYEHFWIWKENGEKEMLVKLYGRIQDVAKELLEKDMRQPDLIFCGYGISRFDMPVLFIRCLENNIAKSSELFSCLFTAKQVDLSNLAISLFPRSKVMYPKTNNDVNNYFDKKEKKDSSMVIWEWYDKNEYSLIEKRTENEMMETIESYKLLMKKFKNDAALAKRHPQP
jgi:hypothetical protein